MIDSGALYVVQTQPARLSSTATLKSTVDFVHEGLITKEDALLRIEPQHITEVLKHNTDSSREARTGNLPIQIQPVTNDESPAYKNSGSPSPPELQLLLEWADELKELTVLANADRPQDALTARLLGLRESVCAGRRTCCCHPCGYPLYKK
ncbi:hypothetical protein C0Q44_21845 [Paenibacillus sp. PCH8]|nr:hypothetical protein C0Q44_21845 [Paenibacillus sp. PCH8]